MTSVSTGTAEHREVWLHIPWYVSDRLDTDSHERVEAHLRSCATCRAELEQQRVIHAAMSSTSGVELVAGGSWNNLSKRLDLASGTTVSANARPVRGAGRRIWIVAAAASLLLAIFVVSRRSWDPPASDAFYTVTAPTQRPANESIRAVFAPSTTVAHLQTLLHDVHLKIVAGPSEAGVYSLATTQPQSIDDCLRRLRSSPDVRFAEATGAATGKSTL